MVGQDHQAFKPNYRCAYPTDGDTDIRSNSGCGAQILDGKIVPDTAPCASLGITTGQQWIDKYGAIPGSICGFALNPANGSDRRGMEAMIQADAAILKIGSPVLMPWNEVVMRPWPSYAPARIPLMAFFFVPYKQEARSAAHEARPGAREKASTPGTQHERGPARHYPLSFTQQQQKRYYDLTKIFVPLIEISEASPNAVFTYQDSDQAAGIPGIVTTMPQ
ncbi:hypothetical protein AKI39_23075 [Bordetella sp. H567]|uniref:hypothetical protein n=1 Tax=Bordetella sp. H567 TaxID=1697043 RepID=UPI00081CDB9E|nr:hypothetical protein [Bordetella sp. H567]AOB33010.1 hypothetical protein AKI39_23075 [Bordetella sp. H567]